MATRGRPSLSEDVVRQRIADYCDRYGVTELAGTGFPVFPRGKRETRQHREWMVLYKAFHRLRRRTANRRGAERLAALEAQEGRCPICLEEVGLNDELAPLGREDRLAVLHPSCRQFLRTALKLGPAALDRVRGYVRADGRKPPNRGKAS
jgi:hypothetical protein